MKVWLEQSMIRSKTCIELLSIYIYIYLFSSSQSNKTLLINVYDAMFYEDSRKLVITTRIQNERSIDRPKQKGEEEKKKKNFFLFENFLLTSLPKLVPNKKEQTQTK